MKKIILMTVVVSVLAFVFIGCDMINSSDKNDTDKHVHSGGVADCSSAAICDECGEPYGDPRAHSYASATCTTPKTCAWCGAVEGDALGHSYIDANCTTPKTCIMCAHQEGNAVGHSYTDATCAAPKTCTVCAAIEGGLAEHTYIDATCTMPKICTVCGVIVGTPIEHTYTAATCTAPKTCTVCGHKEGNTLEHTYTDATCTEPKTCTVCGYEDGKAPGHKYSDPSCTVPKTCSVCGHKEGALLEHNYYAEYLHDDEVHWRECSVCGFKSDEGNHRGGEMTSTERAKCEVCSAYYGEEPGPIIDWEIEPISPSNGSVISLANDMIEEWCKDYDFTTTDTDQYWLEEDIFRPECPVFEWSVGENARYYRLYISKNPDMSEAQCYLTSDTSIAIEHLYVATTYYWYVDAVYDEYTVRSEIFYFTTDETPRTVDIEGVSNSRDLGGYVTTDGKVIKQGMIYRSAKLDDITELGEYTLLYILGIKTDLDLRGYSANAPVDELNYVPVACPWYSSGSNHIWMNDYNKEEFAKAIKVFADLDNYPIIFHCSLGRDRTGTLAMVLGGLLGLDENTLMMEYELSVFSYWGTNGGTKYNDGLRDTIHDTYLYINDNYEGDNFSEKVENFLLEIGVTAEEIASIRSIMLEEVE